MHEGTTSTTGQDAGTPLSPEIASPDNRRITHRNMAQAQYRTLSRRVLERLSVDGKDDIFWDRDLAGFGVRVYPSGKKMFVVQTRAFGRSKRVTLGRFPDLTPEVARKEAAAVIARIKKGQPVVPPEPALVPTVADLAERYQREYVEMHCKPLTVSHYKLMLRKHIVPGLGERLVTDVAYKDILSFHNGLHHMPTVANRRRRHPGQDVQPGRRMGMASLRNQPLPGRAPLQGREARALPHS